MNTSFELIISDIKKLFKELEMNYGRIKPQICDIDNLERCPNTKCWVQTIREEQQEQLTLLEGLLLNLLINIDNAKAFIQKNKLNDLQDILNQMSKDIGNVLNPTPCKNCIYNLSCSSSYKNSLTTSSIPCPKFSKSLSDQDKESLNGIHF